MYLMGAISSNFEDFFKIFQLIFREEGGGGSERETSMWETVISCQTHSHREDGAAIRYIPWPGIQPSGVTRGPTEPHRPVPKALHLYLYLWTKFAFHVFTPGAACCGPGCVPPPTPRPCTEARAGGAAPGDEMRRDEQSSQEEVRPLGWQAQRAPAKTVGTPPPDREGTCSWRGACVCETKARGLPT